MGSSTSTGNHTNEPRSDKVLDSSAGVSSGEQADEGNVAVLGESAGSAASGQSGESGASDKSGASGQSTAEDASGSDISHSDGSLSDASNTSELSSTLADLSTPEAVPLFRLSADTIDRYIHDIRQLALPEKRIDPAEMFCNEDWALAGKLKLMKQWALHRNPELQEIFALTTWTEIIQHFVKHHQAISFVERFAQMDPRELFQAQVADGRSLTRIQAVALWEGCCAFLLHRASSTKRMQISAATNARELNEACFDFVFSPDPSAASLLDRLQSTITHIVDNLDSRMKILPWYLSNTSKPLQGNKPPPTDANSLASFFPGIDTTVTDRRVYIQVRLLLHVSPSMLRTTGNSRMSGWGRLSNMQIYKKPLSSADDPVEIGWLAYTGNFTNAKELLKLFERINESTPARIDVGFRTKKSNLRPNGDAAQRRHTANGGNWRNQPWFCIHVVCNRPHIDQATDILFETFNTPAAERPFPIHYWFIPFAHVIPLLADEAHLVAKVIPHHDKVVSDFKFLTSDKILHLDKVINGTTLREQIFLLSSDNTGKQLIHSVDMTTSNRDAATTVVFTVSLAHYIKAQQLVSFLPLHLTQDNPSFRKWFVESGVLSDPNIK